MTEATFYPDAHPESVSVDGQVGQTDTLDETGYTWANVRDGAGNYNNDSGFGAWVAEIASSSHSNLWQGMLRSIFLFDISSLPAGVNITNVTLSLYGFTSENGLNISATLKVYSASPLLDTDLGNGDYDSLGTTPLSSGIDIGDWVNDDFNVLTFNSDGKDYVNAALSADGILRLGTREANYDAANVEPSWSYWTTTGFQCRTRDAAGSYPGTSPKLTVTYTSATGRSWAQIIG